MTRNLALYILTAVRVLSSAEDLCISDKVRRIFVYDDKKINQSVLWARNSLEMYQCMADCITDTHCLSVQVSSTERICIALGEKFDEVSVQTNNAPGYMLFQTNKEAPVLGSDCNVTEDCAPVSNSSCVEGMCICDERYEAVGDSCQEQAGPASVQEETTASTDETTTVPGINPTDPEAASSIPEIMTTLSEMLTSFPGVTTTVSEVTVSDPEVSSAISEVATTVPEVTTTVPEDTTTVPEVTTTVPEVTTTVPEDTTTFPEVTTTVPGVTTTVPEVMTTVPEVTIVVTEITTTVSEVTTAVPEATTVVPEVATTVPEVTSNVPEVTTLIFEVPTTVPCVSPVCVNSVCSCDIGFGIDGACCRVLTECVTFNNDFTLYENHAVLIHDFEMTVLQSRQSCQTRCINDQYCYSCEFDYVFANCFLQQVTWWSPNVLEIEHVTASTLYDHYQRGCDLWL